MQDGLFGSGSAALVVQLISDPLIVIALLATAEIESVEGVLEPPGELEAELVLFGRVALVTPAQPTVTVTRASSSTSFGR